MNDSIVEQTSVRPDALQKIDIDVLKEKHRGMGSLPFIPTHVLTGNYNGVPIGEDRVLVSTIVAAPRLKNWGDEYHKDWATDELSSVEALSIKLSHNPDNFWQENQRSVKLTKISGPKGPIYAVEDGSHRVAAAKLSNVLEIPAEVEDLTGRREFSTPDKTTTLWWQALIYHGAIKGGIEERNSWYYLNLEETPELPWIVRPRSDFVETNKVYQQVYGEDALSEIKSVPKEILLDKGKAMVWENKRLREMSEKGIEELRT